MRTPNEKEAWELQAYGCTESQIEAGVSQYFGGSALAFAMSILSDAQEMLEMDRAEGGWRNTNSVRQYMNRAKYLIHRARKDARLMEDTLGTQAKMMAVLQETMKGI